MKIVLVVPQFPKLSETFIVSKFLGLLDKGFDAHIVCTTSDPLEWTRFHALRTRSDVRARVHLTPPDRPRWAAALRLPLVLLRGFVRQPGTAWHYLRRGWARFGGGVLRRFYLDAPLIALAPDVVHFEFGALAPERMYLRVLLDCKLGVSFRGYDLNFVGLDRPNHYGPVWQEADRLHLLGRDLWQRAQRRGCPPEKAHSLIPPAIDLEFFTPPPRTTPPDPVGTADRPLRLLSVGRLDWRKGYEDAMQAVRALRERGIEVEYTIIGGGDYLEALAFCRHEMALEDCVRFAGALPREDVRRAMQGADLYLHPAASEGFCNAVIEAQAMRLPVVTSDAGGLPENVADGESGVIVPRRDVSALADALAALAADPVRRAALGDAGRARVESLFNVNDQAVQFADFYRAIQRPVQPAS